MLNNKSKGGLNMTTIIIKDDKDLLKVKKGDKVIDQRPNQKGEDLEISRHWYEYNEELIQAEKDNNA
jgi:hypothetical protein|tara:strand:+ start:455 stop:655 length:201 start_codon:yes stop_codon:yes gene_type:complete